MGINVLIVDDESYCVTTLMEEIDWQSRDIGQVFGAYNADQARKILMEESVGLILCDIEMPGESGLELIEWVREGARLSGYNTECIILTCHPEYHFMRKAMQIGCSDYLLKPIDYTELHRVLDRAMDKLNENTKEFNRLENLKINLTDTERQDLINEKVIPYIHDHIGENFSITDLAKHTALNPQYMMRLFKKTTGKSIVEYVTAYRMDLAKELLKKSTWNNDIIAERVGYVSSNYFIRLFKKQFNMTPREYRKLLERHGEGGRE